MPTLATSLLCLRAYRAKLSASSDLVAFEASPARDGSRIANVEVRMSCGGGARSVKDYGEQQRFVGDEGH